ncbi:hypothetical protein M409DRAFT_27266 [Zasmidium cellare ATCC 36951]|uniref:CFEM domain-containing protein n=1 Tax=Zasmidium cellare ATCC 36951 TaxID=1080233 RepID=A0A6A6C5U6_ZASCE|nr:uncharacterized protein M409DRAFT_27266 [Zasmidium cellare ATCC 36951]KAF2162263.1 hypothetical protein M409DRAFT_27266 [Zasmidium cellare ATCC 36951]
MYLLTILSLLFVSALAQVGPQAQQLPACIKTCDPPAIASVNCTNADQYCHCVRQTEIISNISACADGECMNPSASLYTFTTLFGDVCSKFNISVPVVGSNSSANGTTVTPPSPSGSIVPYTGSATSTFTIGSGSLSIFLLGAFITALSSITI